MNCLTSTPARTTCGHALCFWARPRNPRTNLGEPIGSLASDAKSDRESSLRSIEGVAEDIREAIDTLNAALEKAPTRAIISRDEQLNRFIVKIADERSGEIVREIPSEAVLKFARNLQEIKGLLFDAAL